MNKIILAAGTTLILSSCAMPEGEVDPGLTHLIFMLIGGISVLIGISIGGRR